MEQARYSLRENPKRTEKATSAELEPKKRNPKEPEENILPEVIMENPEQGQTDGESQRADDVENVNRGRHTCAAHPTMLSETTAVVKSATVTDTADIQPAIAEQLILLMSEMKMSMEKMENKFETSMNEIKVSNSNQMEKMENKFETSMEKMNHEMEKTNYEIKISMERMNRELKDEISEIKLSNSNFAEQLTQTNYELNERMENLKIDLTAQMDNNNERVRSELQRLEKSWVAQQSQVSDQMAIITVNQEDLRNDVDCIKIRQQSQEIKLNQVQQEVKDATVNNQTAIQEALQADLDRHSKTIHNLIYAEDQKMYCNLTAEINETRREFNKRIIDTAEKTTGNSKELETKLSQLETIQEDMRALRENRNTSAIQVICTGNGGFPAEAPLPKFNGRAFNPRDYLERLNRYYQKSLKKPHIAQMDPDEHLMDLLENSMELHAARWFQIAKTDIWDWDSFVAAFQAKYWSRDVQRGVRQRLETDRYRSNGKLSRTEYFTDKVIVLRSLNPPMADDEIVTCLAEHFSEIVQDARRVQNVNTIAEFEALLQREDLKDRHRPAPPDQRSSPPRNGNQYRRPEQNYPAPSRPMLPASRPYGQYKTPGHFSRPNPHREARPYSRPDGNRYQPRPRYGPQMERSNGNQTRPQERPVPEPSNQRGTQKPYPTSEQRQVCMTIAETPPPPDLTPSAPSAAPTLNC